MTFLGSELCEYLSLFFNTFIMHDVVNDDKTLLIVVCKTQGIVSGLVVVCDMYQICCITLV